MPPKKLKGMTWPPTPHPLQSLLLVALYHSDNRRSPHSPDYHFQLLSQRRQSILQRPCHGNRPIQVLANASFSLAARGRPPSEVTKTVTISVTHRVTEPGNADAAKLRNLCPGIATNVNFPLSPPPCLAAGRS